MYVCVFVVHAVIVTRNQSRTIASLVRQDCRRHHSQLTFRSRGGGGITTRPVWQDIISAIVDWDVCQNRVLFLSPRLFSRLCFRSTSFTPIARGWWLRQQSSCVLSLTPRSSKKNCCQTLCLCWPSSRIAVRPFVHNCYCFISPVCLVVVKREKQTKLPNDQSSLFFLSLLLSLCLFLFSLLFLVLRDVSIIRSIRSLLSLYLHSHPGIRWPAFRVLFWLPISPTAGPMYVSLLGIRYRLGFRAPIFGRVLLSENVRMLCTKQCTIRRRKVNSWRSGIIRKAVPVALIADLFSRSKACVFLFLTLSFSNKKRL